MFIMNLSCLLSLIEQDTDFRKLLNILAKPPGAENKLVISDAARSCLIAALYQHLKLPVLVVTSQPENARRLYDELQAWCPASAQIQFFPETDFLAGEASSANSGAVTERLQTLSTLVKYLDSPSANARIPIIVSSSLAVASKTLNRSGFARAYHTVETGMDADPMQLISRWQDMGYDMESVVEVPGTMSRRGGILDVFPVYSDLPARIEFFGNQIESIRLFEPRTQRSTKVIDYIIITPAREHYLPENSSTLLDYIPEKVLLILDDLNEIYSVIDTASAQHAEFQTTETDNGEKETPDSNPLLSRHELEGKIIKIGQRLILYSWNIEGSHEVQLQSLPLIAVAKYGGRLEIFFRELKERLRGNSRTVIISQQTKRLCEILQQEDILAYPVAQLEKMPPPGSVTLVQGSLAEGWELKNSLTILTDNEIFGLVKERRLLKRRPVRHHRFVPELTTGDYLVHIDHGIGKYIGLSKKLSDGIEREYLVLEYGAGDRLYVPTDQVDRVSRYVGGTDRPPSLSRLGTQEWATAKQRIKKSVADMAEELLTLYAAREAVKGFAFSPDNAWQQEMESSFPYIETPDQMAAVRAVKADMEITKPMDRLVCGDVGYGKTEIALRAAFKSVMSNKQVALLVPTTVLAQQHIITFQERLLAFPLRVEALSRFTSEKDQARIIEGLSDGTVDICIGTHRLLQKDVKFKDLGLLIIDEEQRFGVAHKEYFKKLRQEIDILTLSATPIPRTLHMALSGIRDLSIMETPPENRLPIKTMVGAYDDRLVREAILRELERNGQVFFIHNRIYNIHALADKLHHLVPEARISVAHGRLQDELEEVMADFAVHKSDVLLTTTIIESGLDMPNVNTLIIDESDKLGLTQLYQLRGRVGRGNHNAYAYFLFQGGKQLTPQSQKRLKAIAEATELGAGFAIAMKDLEIRGSGNLLGAEQSGYIATVGFDLYCRLLTEAVDEARQKRAGKFEVPQKSIPAPSVALPLVYHIPAEFISRENTRITFYQKLSAASGDKEIADIAEEMADRFGALPLPVTNLLYMVKIRRLAAEAGIESISTRDKQLILQFHDPGKLEVVSRLKGYEGGIRAGTRQITLDLKYFGDSWQEALGKLLAAAASLS
jgi:transcription-repair coupling factor (superfamily II helicase)